jgi:hypothetical protein
MKRMAVLLLKGGIAIATPRECCLPYRRGCGFEAGSIAYLFFPDSLTSLEQ